MGPVETTLRIKNALRAVEQEISDFANQGNAYARGLAREGWNGGYASALYDVLLLIQSDTIPDTKFWR